MEENSDIANYHISLYILNGISSYHSLASSNRYYLIRSWSVFALLAMLHHENGKQSRLKACITWRFLISTVSKVFMNALKAVLCILTGQCVYEYNTYNYLFIKKSYLFWNCLKWFSVMYVCFASGWHQRFIITPWTIGHTNINVYFIMALELEYNR